MDLFHRHNGLTRGLHDLKPECLPGEANCELKEPQLVKYDPYKGYADSVADIVPCTGPRGVPINESDEDSLWAYPGLPRGQLFTLPFLIGMSDVVLQVPSNPFLARMKLLVLTALLSLTASDGIARMV